MDQENTPQTPQPSPPPHATPAKKRSAWKWLSIAIIIILLVAIGLLAWQLWLRWDEKMNLQEENDNLRTQITTLTQQLQEADAKSQSESEHHASACEGTVVPPFKEDIRDAVGSKNYAALVGRMTENVNVVLAASEKGGPVTPTQAAKDLEYLSSATPPWDFNLSTMILGEFEDGDYSQYFGGNAYVGRSSDSYVVSFKFDDCGKINTIFMSPSTEIL